MNSLEAHCLCVAAFGPLRTVVVRVLARRSVGRGRRYPPAALNQRLVFDREQPMPPQRRGRAGRRGAPERRREAQGSWPRAQRASLTDSAHLSERSEHSERRELCDGPRARCTEPGHEQSCGLFVPGEGQGLWPWPQGSRSAAETASPKRCGGLPAPAFAVPTSAPERGQRLSAMGRKLPAARHVPGRRRSAARGMTQGVSWVHPMGCVCAHHSHR